MAEIELFEAASRNDATTLQRLLVSDPLLLERVSFTFNNKTPLHVATMKGNLAFVQQTLNRNPELAEVLDSQQLSPLHIASAKGYVEIVRILLDAAPDMCLSRDCQGKNPLHLAAIKGQVGVLEELVRARPLAAGEKLDRGQNVLHLCVKHNQLESLRILVQNLNNKVVINAKDDDGDTILHLAVRDKHIETIRYMVDSEKIDLCAKDSMGLTALDISEQTSTEATDIEIRSVLRSRVHNSKKTQTKPVKWLTEKRDSIMVAAVLTATMAFQAAVSPPGGFWQEDFSQDSQGKPVPNPHTAGESVMSQQHPGLFKYFIMANDIAFGLSITIIMFLMSGLPTRNRVVVWNLMVIMWLILISIIITYCIAISAITPKKDYSSIPITLWSGMLVIFLIGNIVVKIVHRWLKSREKILWPPRRITSSVKAQV